MGDGFTKVYRCASISLMRPLASLAIALIVVALLTIIGDAYMLLDGVSVVPFVV